jgi:hypothetical protein
MVPLYKHGFKFLMENKGMQKMFKDMEKLSKELDATMKKANEIKKMNKY